MPRWWSVFVAGAGVFCLLPAVLVTVMYYRHMWHYSWSELGLPFAVMTAFYAVLLSGPTTLLASSFLALRKSSRRASERCALLGGGLTLAYSLLGLAAWPPDIPVRVVVASMALASMGVLVGTLRRRAQGEQVAA